jgi:hypothetical protein
VPAVIRQTVLKNVFISVDVFILFHQHRKDAMAQKRYSVFIRL